MQSQQRQALSASISASLSASLTESITESLSMATGTPGDLNQLHLSLK